MLLYLGRTQLQVVLVSLYTAEVGAALDILGGPRLTSFTFYCLCQKPFHSPSGKPSGLPWPEFVKV